MHQTVRVDFHLHSDRSDGYCSPAMLAERLAASGVSHAALTDHNTLDGQQAFREAFAEAGGVAITGLEVFVHLEGQEAHLLAYGFALEHPAIRPLLGAPLPAEEAIAAIHRAEGLAFLAHPLNTWKNPDDLEHAVRNLKRMGLDGLEAVYRAYAPDEQRRLLDLASRYGLLVCGGSDYHDPAAVPDLSPGVDLETRHWKQFRDALAVFRGPAPAADRADRRSPERRRRDWRWLVLRILLPAVIAVGLFITVIFAVLLPQVEENLLARKREMIRELTNSAWSILDEYEREYQEGRLTRSEAQALALERIKYLRYGPEGKDYFWITDTHPHMVMHPYRPDLNEKDLSDFTDPQGVRLFVEFVRVVRERQHGYVDYVWQWKDDPERLEPKESYVRGFAPWGWIIGTGIYTEDVRQEIAAMDRRLIDISVSIGAVIALLLLYIVIQSARMERRRSQAEHELRLSHEKYRALVEATTEGTLMVLGRRCAYANQPMLQMIGYSDRELPLLDVSDLFPSEGQTPNPVVARFEALLSGRQSSDEIEGRICRKDRSLADVLLSVTRVAVGGQQGLVVVAKDLRFHKELEARLGESLGQYRALAAGLTVGIIRAAAEPPWRLVEANPAACVLLGLTQHESAAGTDLGPLLVDAEQRDRLFHQLTAEGQAADPSLSLRRPDGSVVQVRFWASLARGPDGLPRFLDGQLAEAADATTPPADVLTELQAALEFLNEPVRTSMQPLEPCTPNTPIDQAAQLMMRRQASLAVVASDGQIMGVVTDQEIGARVIAEGHSPGGPVHEIMSTPVVTIGENALVYEALRLMQDEDARHVVVRDAGGLRVGLVRREQLSRFHYYSPAVLSRERRHAAAVTDAAQQHARLPWTAKALIDLGARPRSVTRAVTAAFDAAAGRLITLAMQDLGPPPLPFAFIGFGSIGREEQTLVTDQDNALIYADPSPETAETVATYFRLLGRHLCDDLRGAGYPFCKGDVMASSPHRNLSLSKWKECFRHWIDEPNPQELMQFTICFDFRCVYGDTYLASELRQHIHETLKREPPFFFHLARNCLQYSAPLGLFGQIVTGAARGESKTVNVKDALLPVVNFARLYALQAGLEATNTADRLQELIDAQVLRENTGGELLQAYDFLMLLRFRRQVTALNEGRMPDNLVDLADLSDAQLATLKKAFAAITTAQQKINFDFPGTV